MTAWLATGLALVVGGIGFLLHDKWNWQDAAGIAFFAAIAAYPAALLVRRARRK